LQNINVKGQLVQKLLWKQTDKHQTDTAGCNALPANAVAKTALGESQLDTF